MSISCFTSVSAVVSCAILLGGCRGETASLDESVDPDEAFLQQVRQSATTASAPFEASGAIQPGNRVAKVELETDDFEMGVIAYDRVSTREVKIYNRGAGNLKISQVTTTCNCTVGTMDNGVIPPGEFGILVITVDPSRIPGFYMTKRLTLFTNDPTNAFPTIDVTTRVEAEAEFSPDEFRLGGLSRGEGAEMVTHVRQIHETPLEIFSVVFSRVSPYFSVDFEEVSESEWRTPGKREYVITARILPGAPPGEYRKVIHVRSNLEYQPKISLPIYATVME